MTLSIDARLDLIIDRVTDTNFLSSQGIGNEIACYIFDYDACDELRVRKQLDFLNKRFASHHKNLRVLHLNLFDLVVEHLKERGFLEKALQMSESQGDTAVLKALKGLLTGQKLCAYIDKVHNLGDYNLIMMSGVGSVWPMMRVHGLLNNLHNVMGHTPLVMFYPGTFDGTTLRPFGRAAADTPAPAAKQYYRAFTLIPREKQS